MTALKALSFFTYKVTMPYLNMVERCNQNDLVKILPKLCRDLEKGNLETLADYHVPWMHQDIIQLLIWTITCWMHLL